MLSACLPVLLCAACASSEPATEGTPLRESREADVAKETSGTTSLSRPRRLAIDLPAAIDLAGARDPELRLARLAIDQARNTTFARELSLLPTVYPIFRAFSHRGQAQTQAARNVNVDRQNFELQVLPAFQWDPGRVIFHVLASQRREDAAQARSEAQRLRSVYEAAHDYFDLVRAYTEVAIAESAVIDAEGLLRFDRARVRAGAAVRTDELRAQAEVARRKHDLADAVGHVARASARLASLLYLDANVELIPSDRFPVPLDLVPADMNVVELARRAESDRPEIAEAEAELAAREHERESVVYGSLVPFVASPVPARAAYPPLLPTLLRGSGPYDEITTTRSAFLPQFGQWGPGGPWAYGQYYGPDSPFGDTGRTGFFGPTLGSLSFSQDFMVYAGIRFGPGGIGDIPEYRKRGLAVEEQRARADRLNARVHYEAARAAAHVVAARDRLEAAKTGLEASQEAFRLERDRFEKGIAIQLDVLDARAVLVNAESSEVEAIVDYDDAQYELLTTIGRTTPLSR